MCEDLEVDGLDLDYEEFWHADWHRRTWYNDRLQNDVEAVSWKNNSNATDDQKFQDFWNTLNYTYLIENYAAKEPNRDAYANVPLVMPETVDKVHRIITALETAAAGKNLKFSFAGPAVGAIPVMTL